MPRSRVLAGVMTCATFAVGVPCAAQETWVKLEGPAYAFMHANRTSLSVGDTLRLRAMVVSTADTTLTLHVRPCGMAVDPAAVLQVRPLREIPECAPQPHRLEPGDSVWAAWAGVMGAPAQGEVHVRYAAHPDAENPDARMGALVVTVRSEPRTERPPAPHVERLPYVLHFAAETSETSGYDADLVRAVIEREVARRPFVALEFSAATAERLRVPHMKFDVVLAGQGGYELRTHWQKPDDRGALFSMKPCANERTGSGFNPGTFGAILALFIGESVERLLESCRG